ncbi:hypothetical protein EXIGLDRAFT_729562 [Exidia glandulosa HHB12029]|uniref:Uncharacterized protein n=1 Tax=Exidia glandulosa HHB12029 TaxID=1314781 RepID=A0A165CEK6_EXIGL|nr:hypothetical protein EXIGLDRAFT_729900 [Exidia glandulosa HHB12029]KZV82521.1 hypothetical protein EXIGLDRAFT_729562 [Exidia glandulosa HHB12029]
MHIDYSDVKMYWMDVYSTSQRSPAAPYNRYGICHVFRRDDPPPEDTVMRRASWKATNKTGRAWHTVDELVNVVKEDKAHEVEFKGEPGSADRAFILEWCLRVLRLWAKKGLIVADEEGLNKWKHIDGWEYY